MRRFHLIELHEQTWIPALWRKMFQEAMGKSLTLTGVYNGLAEPFSRFLRHTGARQILDLCAGSASPPVALRESLGEYLDEASKPTIVVSDLFPNIAEFERVKKKYPGIIDYYPRPVNALEPPADAPRVWTMFSSLHHFKPEQAEKILSNAASRADGIAIFEATGRTWLHLIMALPVPLIAALICAFLLRPFRLSHLFWGVLIPVVPLIAFFDTIVSDLRTYTVDELESFTRAVDVAGFEWEVGTVPMPNSKLEATYLFGWRTGEGAPATAP